MIRSYRVMREAKACAKCGTKNNVNNRTESPWFCRRLDLLDSDQGLVDPLGIVERGLELRGGNVAEVAV